MQKSNPNKIGAYQAFVSEMETLAQKRKQTNALGMSKHLSRVIIEKSGSVYSQYSEATQIGFRQVAQDMRDDRLAAENDRIAFIAQQIEDLKQQCKDDHEADHPMLLSRCRFAENDVQGLEQTILNWPETAVDIKARCDDNCAKTYTLPAHIASTLAMFEVQEVTQLSVKFPWLSSVCQNREFFQNTVFKFTTGDSSNYYKFVFAMKNPLFTSFVQVAPFERVIPLADPMAQMHKPELYCWDHYFSCSWDTFCSQTKPLNQLQLLCRCSVMCSQNMVEPY